MAVDRAGINTRLETVETTLTSVLTDGDRGDIVLSAASTTWTIDNDVVSNAKLANMANSTIKGRTTAGTGDPEDMTAAQTRAILGLQRVVKAADESVTNSTTLQNDDELTTNIVSGTSYTFIAKLFISNAGATAGVKVAVNGTGTVSALKSQVRIFDDVTNTIAELNRATSLGGSVGVGLSTGNGFAMLEGSFTCNGSGTFVVQWAQNTADAGNATTVQSMSSLEVYAV